MLLMLKKMIPRAFQNGISKSVLYMPHYVALGMTQ